MMSTSLYWRPVQPKQKNSVYDAKFALRKLYGGPINETLTEANIPVLRGVLAGLQHEDAIKAVEEIIAAIEKHEEIELYEY